MLFFLRFSVTLLGAGGRIAVMLIAAPHAVPKTRYARPNNSKTFYNALIIKRYSLVLASFLRLVRHKPGVIRPRIRVSRGGRIWAGRREGVLAMILTTIGLMSGT